MDRVRIGFLVATFLSIAFLVLLLLQVGGYSPTWAQPDSKILWAPWVEVVKFLAPLVASLFLFYQAIWGNILATVRFAVKLIALGNLLIAIGMAYELSVRLFQHIDPPAFSLGTPFFLLGAILVPWSLFAFPLKLKVTMALSQKFWYTIIIILVSLGSIFILILPPFIFQNIKIPDTMNMLSSFFYAFFVAITLIGATRLSFLFASGRVGRPFRFIAIGAFCIVAYEYFVWTPLTVFITVFHPINVLFVACFMFTTLGAIDLTLE